MTVKVDFTNTRTPGSNDVSAEWLNEVGDKANTCYVKPSGGIPNADIADDAIGIDELSATGTPSETTYLRGNNTWGTPSGTGDVTTNTTTSVDSELALFSGTNGKILKRASGSGLAKLTSGVLGTASAGSDYLAPSGALGTPASGTLSNCSGLPVSGITPSTSTALGVGSIQLGHASDTTIARVSAGVISVEGINVVLATALADVPHYLIWSGSAWPDRPNDDRPAIFVGGSTATDAPDDVDLNSGDVWIPATA